MSNRQWDRHVCSIVIKIWGEGGCPEEQIPPPFFRGGQDVFPPSVGGGGGTFSCWWCTWEKQSQSNPPPHLITGASTAVLYICRFKSVNRSFDALTNWTQPARNKPLQIVDRSVDKLTTEHGHAETKPLKTVDRSGPHEKSIRCCEVSLIFSARASGITCLMLQVQISQYQEPIGVLTQHDSYGYSSVCTTIV